MPKTVGNIDVCNAVIIVSCSLLRPEEIVLNILGMEHLPNPVSVYESLKGYPWHIDTKYYSADVHLFPIENKDLISSAFADSVQAVIIHFDSKEINSFNHMLSWMPFIKNFSPQVQLLACNNCSSENENSALTKKDIINWCIENQFELVELNPDEESDDEDDFKETTGYARIIQALHAHSWSDLIMKDGPSYIPSQQVLSSLAEDLHSNADGQVDVTSDFKNLSVNTNSNNVSESCSTLSPGKFSVKSEKAKKQACNSKIDSLLNEDQWLFDAIGKEDPSGQSFESLFEKFRSMKEKAATLSGDERRQYAEKVALAFWQAVGGDEDEIDGLSSDED